MSDSAPRFTFRPLTEDDLPLLHDWLNRPHWIEWWGDPPSFKEVRAKYLPRLDDPSAARPFLAFLGDEPMGYIQRYDAHANADWWPDEPGPGVVGIDQSLADGDRLGQGLGTAMVRQFCEWIFEDPAVTEIRLDPRPDNLRAIRCYEKVGFRSRGEITTPDGAAVWMVLERS